ncbi:MAG: alpha/beta hydrolase [Bacteroidia bacterium]|jgi:pimeloyl-ACP methyl ester carboxylesterase|nr:alpha/beta hydrolase [Bacteroidia bacterium]
MEPTQLLLLHGALGSKLQFTDTLSVLTDAGFAPDAINFAGHGGFAMPMQGYGFGVFADDILRYADAQQIDKINLFGYSMGGYAALYFAKLYPDRVNRIATLNVKFNWDALSTQKEVAMLNADKMIEKVPSFADKLMLQHGMNIWKQVLQQTASMMEQLSQNFVLTNEDFANIKCKVLLGIGDRDTTSSIDENLAVFKLLPNAQFWVLPNTPHPFERVNRTALVAQLQQFWKTD